MDICTDELEKSEPPGSSASYSVGIGPMDARSQGVCPITVPAS